jgi:hypothetical protein
VSARRRWGGLVALALDGLEHGSRAIERVHVETARRAFRVLEAIPPTAPVAAVVRVTHDATVAIVHGAIRLGGRALGAAADAAFTADGAGSSISRGAVDAARDRTHSGRSVL